MKPSFFATNIKTLKTMLRLFSSTGVRPNCWN